MPGDAHTTAALQHFLDDLGGLSGDAPIEPVVRALMERAVGRLRLLCATLLHRSYPRLTRPPLNLETDELLSAVVERLLKAMREVHPTNVRQFFALANQHMRWELNDLARRLDERSHAEELREDAVPASGGWRGDASASQLSPVARRMFEAIDNLPDEERETFELVRIQGLTHAEASEIMGVSAKTVQRKLNRSLVLLTESLASITPPPTRDRNNHA